jgi:DNA polymerase-3 subunit gamma/tau
VLFPPQAGRYKVYMIDEVHMLSNSAFNALLKTIEEPPPYIVFIFATTELHKVPATIKSRCQQFNFRLIPIETIQGILKNICAETKIEAEDGALFWIARESTGSLRDAFTLFDQVASFSGGHIRGELIQEKLGLVGLEKLNALAEACAANDTKQAFALIDEILDSGVAIEQFIIDLASYYRSLLLLKNGIERESLLGYSPKLFSAAVLELDSVRLGQALDLLLACYRDIRYSVSPRFELETVISKLSWLSHWVAPAELKAVLVQAQSALRGQGASNAAQDGLARPLADAAFTGREGAAEAVRKDREPAGTARQTGEGGPSLSENFRRMLAAKAAGMTDNSVGDNRSAVSAGDENEEDVPLWDGIVQGGTVNRSAGADQTEAPVRAQGNTEDTRVERVLRLIPGIIVQ